MEKSKQWDCGKHLHNPGFCQAYNKHRKPLNLKCPSNKIFKELENQWFLTCHPASGVCSAIFSLLGFRFQLTGIPLTAIHYFVGSSHWYSDGTKESRGIGKEQKVSFFHDWLCSGSLQFIHLLWVTGSSPVKSCKIPSHFELLEDENVVSNY